VYRVRALEAQLPCSQIKIATLAAFITSLRVEIPETCSYAAHRPAAGSAHTVRMLDKVAMTTCPGCSSSVQVEALASPACGASLVDESTPTKYQPAPPGDRARRSNVSTPSGAGGEARFVTGAVLAGRDRIVSLVGKGGMGEVYKAEDLKLNQVVALKLLPEAVALDGAMARFHNEVRIARQGVWQFVFFLSVSYPLTTDLSIWYANRSIFALGALAILACYGAYVSLGGQRMFQGRLLEE
jgi:hypothetical protein